MPEQLTLFDASQYDRLAAAPATPALGSAETAALFVHSVERWLQRYTNTLTALRAA